MLRNSCKTLITLAALNLLISGCSAAQNSTTIAPKQVGVKGQEIHPLIVEKQVSYLVSDNKTGIQWRKTNAQADASWSGRVASMDWRFVDTKKQQLLIAALDSETSDVDIIELDLTSSQFTPKLLLKATDADVEAVCLANIEQKLYLFTVDALGQANQFLIANSHDAQPRLINMRQLTVGYNVKDCAVDDSQQQLLTVEEELGIWSMDAKPEGQLERNLLPFNAIEVESISVVAPGVVSYVSQDANDIIFTSLGEEPVKVKVSAGSYNNINAFPLTQGEYSEVVLGLYNEDKDELTTKVIAISELSPLNLMPTKHLEKTVNATFVAAAQTHPVQRHGDAADDPAIWINSDNPEKSLILGTDKKFGLNVYTLAGELLQSMDVGRINNIDVRKGVLVGDTKLDIAVASNRTHQSMTIFGISPDAGEVSYLADIDTNLDDVYGICLYQHAQGLDVLINDTSGTYNQYRLNTKTADHFTADLIHSFTVDSQPEGCVVEDASGRLFYGEESTGVWLRNLETPAQAPQLIALAENTVEPDIEGMGLYYVDNQAYLVVSSQGNNSFAVYAVDNGNKLLGTFDIGINYDLNIDGVSETDGLEATSVNLGRQFPKGLLVVQDGHNVMPLSAQNFKLVSGELLHKFILENR
ncbi:phytase [Glaciecola sp. 1036]|uniref:phytase n=1 Tax=Alteromonadaceae TaxID=72275 RepID=UPI003D02C549